jgi:succinyl-diaminopimelate desuccinylase
MAARELSCDRGHAAAREAAMTHVRETILRWIEEDRNKLIGFLSQFVQIASPNPPGDTRQAAVFLHDTLKAHGVPVEYRSARAELPNVVGTFAGARRGPHLVLNGHIDVFPAGPPETWSRDPWSGAIDAGKVHGRGSGDMKCGTAASLFAYIYLFRLRAELGGRLTLTCVSDEETGGTWGAKWLIDSFPEEFRGDCVLNGEPSTPGMVRFGEKGTLRVVVDILTPGAHAAYTHASKNAIKLASDLIRDLYAIEELPVAQPAAIARALAQSQPAIDRALGAGGGAILNRYTVSVGVISGGVKINMLPGHCRFEADIRLPVATTHAALLRELAAIVARYPEAKLQPVWTHSAEPSISDPGHPMMQILRATVKSLTGEVPVASVSLGATDMKHWRHRGVPAFVYGCTPTNMAKPDEWVAVEEYLHILRTHALATAAYLAP